MSEKKGIGTLILIGGHEDKEDDKTILREVARRIGNGKLVIATVASHEPDGVFPEYERIFRSLGVEHIYKLEIRERMEAKSEAKLRILDDATGVFFTGGDQLKITSQLGDTPIYQRIQDIYRKECGIIVGTSAGASVVCETMVVRGNSDESHRVRSALLMAPGFGLIKDVIIDQHFAERGRIGRLIGAIAQNPRNLGIGIDEDTAIIIEDENFYVLGSGAVYIIDGTEVTYSNIAEASPERTMSIYDVTLHILCQEDGFNLVTRRPGELTPEQKKQKLPSA